MKPVYSVIVPAYNEEAVLDVAFTRIDGVMREMGEPYEIVFVNDGSRDKTAEILRTMAAKNPQVRALHFARNFGHQIAVTAGLDSARGDAIVIIDADLQDPPEVIVQMAEKWREGYDVVYGKRVKREGESLLKRSTAFVYYRVLRKLMGFPLPADTGDFRLVSKRAADAVRAMPEHNRFLRGMFAWVGFKQTEVLFERDARYAGVTKYSLRRMVKLAMDGILSFSVKPLDWMTWLGLLMAAGGGIWLLVLLCMRIGGASGLGGMALAALAIFLAGTLAGCIGMLGAYLGRIYDEVKGRPLYIIAEQSGTKDEQFADQDKKHL